LLIPLSISAQSSIDIPSWVKTNAVWWGDGQISDSEFLSALQYLINNGLLKVENSKTDDTETVNKIMNLEIENRLLKIENEKLQTTIDNMNSKPIVETNPTTVDWEYEDILRNENYYIGKIIHLTGEISIIEKYSGDDSSYEHWVLFTVDTGESSYDDGYFGNSFYVWYDGSRLLMGDIIEVDLIIDDIVEEEFIKGYPRYVPIGTAKQITCTSC
jgi:hypothetical protein